MYSSCSRIALLRREMLETEVNSLTFGTMHVLFANAVHQTRSEAHR